jgi:hypothetical protein
MKIFISVIGALGAFFGLNLIGDVTIWKGDLLGYCFLFAGIMVILWAQFLMEEPPDGQWPVFRKFVAKRPGKKDRYERVRTFEPLHPLERQRLEQGLAEIRASDPGFAQGELGFRAEAAARLLLRRPASAEARAYLSDGLLERWAIERELAGPGRGDPILECDDFGAARLEQAESRQGVDTAVLRMRLLRPAGSTLEELWAFARRRPRAAHEAPACPRCGAPVEGAQATRCPSCGSWIESGEFNWLLVWRATQQMQGPSADRVPGLDALERADPASNPLFLRDRALVAFWRWRLAQARGDDGPVRAVFAQGLWPRLRSVQAPSGSGSGPRPRLGAVRLEAIELGPAFDHAQVSIRWWDVAANESAKDASRRDPMFVLQRKSGVRTVPAAGFRSTCCPDCGGVPDSRDLERCAYCGTLFNDGSRDWVVAEVQDRDKPD